MCDLEKYAYRPDDEWTPEDEAKCRVIGRFLHAFYDDTAITFEEAEAARSSSWLRMMQVAGEVMDELGRHGLSIVKTHEPEPQAEAPARKLSGSNPSVVITDGHGAAPPAGAQDGHLAVTLAILASIPDSPPAQPSAPDPAPSSPDTGGDFSGGGGESGGGGASGGPDA